MSEMVSHRETCERNAVSIAPVCAVRLAGQTLSGYARIGTQNRSRLYAQRVTLARRSADRAGR